MLIPAQAGTHGSACRAVEKWVPACAGMMRLEVRAMKLLLSAAIGLLILCSAGVHASELRIALNSDPDQLDPAQGTSFVGREVFAALCDKLIDIAPDMRFVPQLATEWTWSDDAKSLTLNL